MKITSIEYNSKVVSFKGREDTNDIDKKTDRSFITRKLDELKSRRAIWGTMPKSDGSLFSDIQVQLELSRRKESEIQTLEIALEEINALSDYFDLDPEQIKINQSKDNRIILDYVHRIKSMEQMDYGFERIYGYEKEKEYLRREFGIKKWHLQKLPLEKKLMFQMLFFFMA